MTRDEAKAKLNCKSSKELAEILNISPEAVSQWDPLCIPKRREYEVLEKALQLGCCHVQTVSDVSKQTNV